ncbi:protein FAM162B-like [Pelodiscus sinensis]|uniref:protein FAM162B-like n=1 Tax=Pelodiscus sinensis TaxID=13735 RepID=UPI0003C4B3B1|nr:protein FAM162B-like [Pelodiscus sinensis]|eukprot:XP_025046656.1 protein FAM162B-like [Pelodiscus sinensis]
MWGRLWGRKALVTSLWRTTALGRDPGAQAAQRGSRTRRALCDKAADTPKVAPQTASPGRSAYRNDRRPTAFEKKILLWAGRFKKEEDIPMLVSSEVITAAMSRVRIRVCYITMALTLLGCLAMIISGKRAARQEDTLQRRNLEKKAKWRAEAETELEAGAIKAP